MGVKKDVVYPVFLECCQYADDTFWETIFEDLAYAKAPYGTYISKNFLCCSYKKKEFSYRIEKKNAKEVHDDVYKLLTQKLGILSQRERLKKKRAFHDVESGIKDSRKSWSDIRKKNMKELLLELYITRMKKKHCLTVKQSRYLLSILMIALTFKVITAADIDYRDDRIHHIDGIDFAKRQVIIKHDIYNLEVSFAPHIVVDKKSMAENWEKYLKDLRKISET